MKKATITIVAMVTILASLCILPGFQPAEALTTSVEAGPLYRSDYGWLCAHYGYSVAYDGSGGPSDSANFYPSLEVATEGLDEHNCYYTVYNMKITVTGTKPDGNAISGISFGDLGQINSPKATGTEWGYALTTIYNVLTGYDPYHITGAIKIADQTGASIGYDSQSAWANWNRDTGYVQKGLQFRFELLCDPSLGGTYTLAIHYHVEIFVGNSGGYVVNSSDFYQYITYEFTPPHVSSDIWWGTLVGYGQTFTGWNIIGYAADENNVYLQTWQEGDGCGIIGQMNVERSGQTDIYVYGMDSGTPSHIYVYVSYENNYDWQQVGDFISDGTVSHPYYAGYASTTFNYIAVASYHDEGYEPTIFLVDCVTTT
jgi:hypothetical protein